MERDKRLLSYRQLKAISTHTLTWSVTDFKRLDYFRLFISTHTLTWSVTGEERIPEAWADISTHTLTWSVTCSME